ncbi:hypothetical protein TrVE_jg3858 [Triparma verrucosa]|uniref:Uncharacterized protein n=1 Tax=Triparma verrucosa TaxID=1606542 RepID=A0A9W7C792_9STRA|nr:hypothetical protein TrVE_jg3858 [Triparma verrucosa]
MVSASGIFTESLATDCGINIPTFQTFLVYTLLSLFTLKLHKRQYVNDPSIDSKPYRICSLLGSTPNSLKLSSPWYYYLLISFLDVESNFLVVTSFKMTSLTSISLIDCTSIPFVMFFSKLLLSRSYIPPQYLAALISVLGILLIILSDTFYPLTSSTGTTSPSPLLGDIICLCGAFLYALNNVLCEKFVKVDRYEYLGMMGFFASIISAAQMVVLEREEVEKLFVEEGRCSSWRSGGLIGGYVVSIASFYVLVTGFLVDNSAALLNVSLLTADVYSLIFVVFAEKVVPGWLYFLGTLVVFWGVGLFNYHEKSQEGGREEGEGIGESDKSDLLRFRSPSREPIIEP